MPFDKPGFLTELLHSPGRKAIPLMTSPGAELIGASPRELFQNGELQFRCIRALAEAVPAAAHVTFMDLSVEAEAFGSEIAFRDAEAPTVARPLAGTPEAIEALPIPKPGAARTAEALRSAELCARHLERPTFCGIIGPYSLAGRLADLSEMMILTAAEPETAHTLLRKTTAFLKEYLLALKATGVAGVVIAEPAAGLLSPEMCGEFSAAYLKEIIAAVKDEHFFVILHNCGKTEKQVEHLLSTGADALHVGNAVDIRDILRQVPESTPVLGNLDPAGVFRAMTSKQVFEKTLELLRATAPYPHHVLSSGCDLPPGVPMSNVKAFFEAQKQYNREMGK